VNTADEIGEVEKVLVLLVNEEPPNTAKLGIVDDEDDVENTKDGGNGLEGKAADEEETPSEGTKPAAAKSTGGPQLKLNPEPEPIN